MNYLDIGMLTVMGVAFFAGMTRGLVVSVFSLAGIVLGVWFAGRFHTAFSDSTAGQVVAFVIILAVVAAAVTFIGRIVSRILHLTLLGWLDTLLGGVLGAAIAAVVIALVLVAYLRFIGPADLITNSAIARVLVDRAPLVLGLLPENFRQIVVPYFR